MAEENEIEVVVEGEEGGNANTQQDETSTEQNAAGQGGDDEHGDDEHGDDDPRLSGEDGDSDEDPESRTARNRQWREERKRRRKEKEESYRRELAARDRLIAEQEARLAAVERRTQGADAAALDNAIRQAADAYNQFKHVHATAVEQANGAMASDAAEKMALARQRFDQLNGIKVQMSRKQTAPQPLDPRLVNHAQAWMQKNTWYDPSGQDDDSAIALTVDQRMAAQGWDPTTPEYWDELSARVAKVLPHRSKPMYNRGQGASGRPPVAGSGREGSSGSTRSVYKLSSERVKALKDAGVWDDPKQREEYIKNFRDYDKANGLI